MPEYSLSFPVSTPGAPDLRVLAESVKIVADRTKLSAGEFKLWSEYITKGVASGQSLNRVLAQAQTAFGGATGALAVYTSALRDQVRETEKSEAATKRQADTHQRAAERIIEAEKRKAEAAAKAQEALHRVPQMAASSAAIRVAEGATPIRAVERLLGSSLGLGGALQAAFPVVGGIATAEMLVDIVNKIGRVYNAWNPVIAAEERALGVLKEMSGEFRKIEAEETRLYYAGIQRRVATDEAAKARRQGVDRDEGLRAGQQAGRIAVLNQRARDLEGDATYGPRVVA
ncbi:MAG: hypothetical protein NVS1B6_00960 [Steroidobacteraceae bacterium]